MSRHIPRIFLASIDEETFELPEKSSLHLVSVLRFKQGDKFYAFNSEQGEWLCEVCSIKKNKVTCQRSELLRKSTETNSQKLALAICKIKPDNLRLVIEKGTELGATDFYPLSSSYSNAFFNSSKMQEVALNAIQQSERFSIPHIHDELNIIEFVNNLPKDFVWFSAVERLSNFSNEEENAKTMKNNKCGFIIGPEGGFSNEEKEALIAKTSPISLSKNILRSETAAISALSIYSFFQI